MCTHPSSLHVDIYIFAKLANYKWHFQKFVNCVYVYVCVYLQIRPNKEV